MAAPVHETTLRVRYAETDQMGVVYHSNFFIWFEVGRVELLRALGFSYHDMEKLDDSHIVVAEAKCSYKKPARYDDLLRIRARILQVRRRTIRFGYEVIRDSSGQLLATGETLHVICNRSGRPRSLPEKYVNVFSATLRGSTPRYGDSP
ncbi:MAG: acyl-CoA thioesterase [Acidobacteria bacterium]|nr:acyl-CoA thioesterase [Acidobacteriota bacterium]MBI3663142.1 acyl-CoA thioesterase [Acidobacteriota bacterium]